MTPPIPARVAQRAYDRWEADGSGCFISTYSVGSHGYAQLGWTDADGHYGVTAHRAAWVHVHGQLAEGMTVDHKPTCSRRCVNVNHLRELTNFENARRTHGRDWPLGECINGHPNSELVKWGGKWVCRPCRLDIQRRRRARKKEMA